MLPPYLLIALTYQQQQLDIQCLCLVRFVNFFSQTELEIIRPGGLQPCAAEHRGRDERSEVRGPCALLRTAEARRVFQRKTEKKN